jgi:hypothetical protein
MMMQFCGDEEEWLQSFFNELKYGIFCPFRFAILSTGWLFIEENV